jgi:hypothetical protein
LQNKKRVQKLLAKCYTTFPRVEHDVQQRQRHLLSKRTRVSAVKEDVGIEKRKIEKAKEVVSN